MIANKWCKVGSLELPSKVCSCTLSRLASECVSPPALQAPSIALPRRGAEIKRIQIHGLPPLPFPHGHQESRLRQSPPATLIEAAESRGQRPPAAPVPRTLPSNALGQRKRSFTGTTSPLERLDRLREPGRIANIRVGASQGKDTAPTGVKRAEILV